MMLVHLRMQKFWLFFLNHPYLKKNQQYDPDDDDDDDMCVCVCWWGVGLRVENSLNNTYDTVEGDIHPFLSS